VLVTGSPTAPVAIVTDIVPAEVEQALITAVLEARLAAVGLTPVTVTSVVDGTNVIVQSRKPAAAADPQRAGELLGALAVAILLYISLGFYGSLVVQGVVEEKSTRMVEILLATMRPSQLLAGKVLGIGFVGLLQLSIVGAATLIIVAVTHAVALPALGPLAVLGDLAWFTLGFLFYALAFAALAATVSRQEDAAGATAPMNVFLVLGYLLVFLVLPDPSNAFSTFVSLLPPFAPVLMSLRIATGDAQAWQVVLAVVLLVASIGGLTWFAGRMYANSVLRLGKRVRFGDAFRGR
jgi:ABC-2 type transport system permease protein